MRSMDFITEENIWHDNDMIDTKITVMQKEYRMSAEQVQFALDVRQDCKPYLRENKSPVFDYTLYRGIPRSDSIKQIVKKRVRLEGRNPTDMSRYLHSEINIYFWEEFGEEFRDAMFCTGSVNEASGYGDEYVIFPIGDYKYLWSPKINDLFVKYDTFNPAPADEEEEFDFDETFLDRVIYQDIWKTNDLEMAIQSKNEIMIRCKAYHGIFIHEMDDPLPFRGIDEILKL